MQLASNVSILFGDKVVTDQVLELYREKWRGRAILPGIGAHRTSDEEAFQALLFETTPFTISGDGDVVPLIFEASFKRFPYSIDGNRAYASFGLRLMPKQGRVKVELDRGGRNVAINALSVSPSCLAVDLGNGSLHLEIFLQPTKQPKEEVSPPAGFREEVVLKRDADVN